MQILIALGVSLLAAVQPAQPQPTALAAARPVTVVLARASFEEAVSAIARISGVMIEIDQTVSEETRKEPLASPAIQIRDLSVERTIEWLTSAKGLDYTVVDGTSIRIFKKV